LRVELYVATVIGCCQRLDFFVIKGSPVWIFWQLELVHATIMKPQVSDLLIRFLTQLTFIRSFTGMRTHVCRQMGALSHLFTADFTLVRFLTRVDTHVIYQLCGMRQLTTTLRTCEWLLTGVGSFVTQQVGSQSKSLTTDFARVRRFTGVSKEVCMKLARSGHGEATERTFEWFLTGVHSLVSYKSSMEVELLAACSANILRLGDAVSPSAHVESPFIGVQTTVYDDRGLESKSSATLVARVWLCFIV
jgi:hypothetical protein